MECITSSVSVLRTRGVDYVIGEVDYVIGAVDYVIGRMDYDNERADYVIGGVNYIFGEWITLHPAPPGQEMHAPLVINEE